MRNFILSLFIFMAANSAFGGIQEAGRIEAGWVVSGDGNVFFYLTGTHASTACPQIPERWAFDATTPVGKSWLSVLLTAYSSDKAITVEGSGVCIHGNTEGVAAVTLN